MQRSASAATADRSLTISSTETKLLDPADLYRRLDGPPRRRPMWINAVAIAVLAVAATGGVIAFQDELGSGASHVQVVSRS